MFSLIKHDFPKIERIDGTKFGRVYACPHSKTNKIVNYPSVTSVLSQDEHKKEIVENWKARVGEEQAERVKVRAGNRGTRVHGLVEDYLRGKETKCEMVDRDIWIPLKKVLTENITEIHAIEQPMYSEFLECAGTVDLIARWKRKLAIIDIKTSARFKYASDIPDYFEQCSVYAVMFEELTGIPVTLLQIVMGCDESSQILEYDSKRDIHIKSFMRKRREYKETFGI